MNNRKTRNEWIDKSSGYLLYKILEELFSQSRLMIDALGKQISNIENEIFNIDDLMVDINRHVVKRAGKEIYLTRKEFTLLVYLLKNQGLVLSRSMIMEHVWDMSIDPFSNTIESHIMSLRKKIDLPESKKLIHTINGRGYKMDLLEK